MGQSQETSDSWTQPLIVVTEDGSRWINVEDVEEMKWLMKEKRPMLENFIVQSCNKDQNEEIRAYDELEILLYPGTEISAMKPGIVDTITENKLDQTSHSSLNKEIQACDVVNLIIDRLHTIKKRVSVIKPTQSMNSQDPIKHNKKLALVKNRDVFKQCSNIVGDDSGEKYLINPPSTTTDVCVGSITKLQVVAEKMAQKRKQKNSLYVKEKIVCVEYDVYMKKDESVKKMRAYLALQSAGPKTNQYGNKQLTPLKAKTNTNSMQLTEDEIKMIDAEIKEKRGYLDHLRDVLRTDRKIKKHDRAVSTEDLPINDEVYIHKRRVNNILEVSHLQPQKANAQPQKANIQPQKANMQPQKANMHPQKANIQPQKLKQNSSLMEKKTFLNTDTSELLRPYLDFNSNLDHIRDLLQKSTQRDKYLQYMRNLKEIDSFNEKITSHYVDVY